MSQDRPNAQEILDSVIEFLMDRLFSTLEGELAFHVRVSANLLTILKRELEIGEQIESEELFRLRTLLDRANGTLEELTRDLAARIRSGDLDDRRDAVFAEVKRTVEDKLRIVNPKYLEN
jgi:hypothetical protein